MEWTITKELAAEISDIIGETISRKTESGNIVLGIYEALRDGDKVSIQVVDRPWVEEGKRSVQTGQ
jgi:hypothetical protein